MRASWLSDSKWSSSSQCPGLEASSCLNSSISHTILRLESHTSCPIPNQTSIVLRYPISPFPGRDVKPKSKMHLVHVPTHLFTTAQIHALGRSHVFTLCASQRPAQ